MTGHYTTEIEFALQAVRQAALLIRQVQARMVTPALTKGDRSPVTIADYASQALVAAGLSETFPNDPLVAEEDAAALRSPENQATLEQVTGFVSSSLSQVTPGMVCDWIDRGDAGPSGRFWTLDPIDGTKGFLRGDQYAVALALLENGEVQVGVLGCPNLSGGYQPDLAGPGSLVYAVRGQGAFHAPLTGPGEPIPLMVSDCDDPRQARLLRSFESGHTNVDQVGDFAQAIGLQTTPVKMDSQAKYAVLAAGQGELYLRLLSPDQPDYREKIWDQAAGSLILEEAGGQFSDLHGKPLDFTAGRSLHQNRGILASNRRLHAAALEALHRSGA
jgi:HAL2 family 3'(2'),5'-bisphosphate nucleotidase